MRNCFDWKSCFGFKVTKQISVDYAKKTCQCPQLQIEVNFNSFYQHVECPPPRSATKRENEQSKYITVTKHR